MSPLSKGDAYYGIADPLRPLKSSAAGGAVGSSLAFSRIISSDSHRVRPARGAGDYSDEVSLTLLLMSRQREHATSMLLSAVTASEISFKAGLFGSQLQRPLRRQRQSRKRDHR